MFDVHGYLDDKMAIKHCMEHLPRVGETIRFANNKYGIVTEIVWCMDESSRLGQRVNVRIKSEGEPK
jgi:hypothetical protein